MLQLPKQSCSDERRQRGFHARAVVTHGGRELVNCQHSVRMAETKEQQIQVGLIPNRINPIQ